MEEKMEISLYFYQILHLFAKNYSDSGKMAIFSSLKTPLGSQKYGDFSQILPIFPIKKIIRKTAIF